MSPNALYGAQAGSELAPPPAAELELLELLHAARSKPTAARPTTAVADLFLRTPMGSASLKGRLSGFGRPSTGPSRRDVNPSRQPGATAIELSRVTIAHPWRSSPFGQWERSQPPASPSGRKDRLPRRCLTLAGPAPAREKWEALGVGTST